MKIEEGEDSFDLLSFGGEKNGNKYLFNKPFCCLWFIHNHLSELRLNGTLCQPSLLEIMCVSLMCNGKYSKRFAMLLFWGEHFYKVNFFELGSNESVHSFKICLKCCVRTAALEVGSNVQALMWIYGA